MRRGGIWANGCNASGFQNPQTFVKPTCFLCSGDAYFHYLSAQCHAALGDMDAARAAIKQVSAMSETLRSRALDDPAFEAIYGAKPISDNP